jgi:hypothetical protein
VLAKSFVAGTTDFVPEAMGGWLIDLHGDSNPTYWRKKALQSLDARLQAVSNYFIEQFAANIKAYQYYFCP